ncbi:MAG: hypothetical protein IKW39_05995, partial [Alphaproteobacteria bacterium]|nr:hypothetical protein [Alphaproteobacteria bacterium]
CIVLPFAIACYVSKFTSNYTKQAWNLFVNVCANFMIMGVVADFSVKMLERSIGGHTELMSKLTSGGVLQESEVADLYNQLSATAFILTIICCLILFKLFSEVESLAQSLSGAKGVGVLAQKSITPFARTTKGAALWLGTETAKSSLHKTSSTLKNSRLGVALRTRARKFFKI